MKYKNAAGIFPPELLETIQQYVQGEYIYIPIKEKIENSASTDYEVELQKRNAHIYTKSLEGMSNKKLAEVYSLSESSIRRIIINQRKGYELMEGRIKNVLNNWDVTCGKVTQIYKTAWQVGEEYILKVYDEPQKLDRNIKISTILDDLNIPVGKIIPTKEKATFTSDEQYYYVLTERLCGSNIVNLKDYPNIAFEMGKIIANLHVAFKECETQEKFWNNSLLDEMKGWIRSTLNEGGWKYVDAEKFSVIVAQLEALYENLPVQLIHRDVHFGNFLFHEGSAICYDGY